MRHANVFRRFSRTAAHRRSLFRNLATALLDHEKIETTVEKAKDLKRVLEELVTLAGTDSLARRRQAYGYLKDDLVVQKLFTEIGPRFKSRPGGYTRVIRTRVRPGDAADMAIIEFVEKGTGSVATRKKLAAKTEKPAKKAKAATEKVATEKAEKKPARAKKTAKKTE